MIRERLKPTKTPKTRANSARLDKLKHVLQESAETSGVHGYGGLPLKSDISSLLIIKGRSPIGRRILSRPTSRMLNSYEGPERPRSIMLTKTVRSRFSHEVGEKVEGCTILEKRVVIPPNEEERRRGVYDYEVEVPPTVEKPRAVRGGGRTAAPARAAASPSDYTRTTPDEMGSVIRRIPSR